MCTQSWVPPSPTMASVKTGQEIIPGVPWFPSRVDFPTNPHPGHLETQLRMLRAPCPALPHPYAQQVHQWVSMTPAMKKAIREYSKVFWSAPQGNLAIFKLKARVLCKYFFIQVFTLPANALVTFNLLRALRPPKAIYFNGKKPSRKDRMNL